MKTSNMFSLDFKDFAKGMVVAVGGAVVMAAQNAVRSNSLNINWKSIGLTALAAGLSYLAKNFFTPARLVQKLDSNNT